MPDVTFASGPSEGFGPATDPATASAPGRRRPHATDPGRFADGTVRPGNSLAVTHGGRRRATLPAPEGTELYAAWLADLGGAGEVTAAQRAVLQRAAEADLVAAAAVAYLRRSRESLTSRRTQAAVQVLLAASDRVMRAAQLLGLERRQKGLETPADYLRGFHRAHDDGGKGR